MSIRSEVDDKTAGRGRLNEPPTLSGEAIPYLLSTADAFVVLLSSVAGGVAYQAALGNELPSVLPHCAVGLLASFIYILRLSGSGYYDFPDCATPRVEIGQILICWFSTGLLLAFFAFLLKIGVAYSRGAFVLFYFIAPVGLLGVRKATKIALESAVSRGAVAGARFSNSARSRSGVSQRARSVRPRRLENDTLADRCRARTVRWSRRRFRLAASDSSRVHARSSRRPFRP